MGSEGKYSGSEVGAGEPRKPTYSLGLLVPEPSGTECRNRRCAGTDVAYSRPCACVSCIAAKSKPSHSRHSPVSPACVCARNIFLAHFFRTPSTFSEYQAPKKYNKNNVCAQNTLFLSCRDPFLLRRDPTAPVLRVLAQWRWLVRGPKRIPLKEKRLNRVPKCFPKANDNISCFNVTKMLLHSFPHAHALRHALECSPFGALAPRIAPRRRRRT